MTKEEHEIVQLKLTVAKLSSEAVQMRVVERNIRLEAELLALKEHAARTDRHNEEFRAKLLRADATERELKTALLNAEALATSYKSYNERLIVALQIQGKAIPLPIQALPEPEIKPTKRMKIERTRRLTILDVCNQQCFHCRVFLTEETMTIDHLYPLSKGGGNRIGNLVASCMDCNKKKSDRLPTAQETERAHFLHMQFNPPKTGRRYVTSNRHRASGNS